MRPRTRAERIAELEKLSIHPQDEAVQRWLDGERMTTEYAEHLERLFDVPASHWIGLG